MSAFLIFRIRGVAAQMERNAELPQKAYNRKEILLSQAERLKALADELEENAKKQVKQERMF